MRKLSADTIQLWAKNSFVAYFSEDARVHGISPIDVDQTCEAELKAINFSIKELRGKLQTFAIICDSESVVSRSCLIIAWCTTLSYTHKPKLSRHRRHLGCPSRQVVE